MTAAARSIAMVTLRTWLRYIVPLTSLSVIALIAIAWIAAHPGATADAAQSRAQLRLGWILAGVAWIPQLLLVAAVAPAVRGVALGQPLSQGRAFTAGLHGLIRGFVPWLVAIAAIVIGGLALVVPGLLLLCLLAMTGASDHLGEAVPAPLLDSVAVARTNLVRIAIVIGLVIALDLAISTIAQLTLLHAGRKPPVLPSRLFLRTIAIGLVAISPLSASALAAAYHHSRR